MTPERTAKLIQTLNRRQPDLTLITDQVHKPRNIAALIRTCDAVGISRIHTVSPKEGYEFTGTTRGSDRWVASENHNSIGEAVGVAKAQGMKIYAAHFSDRAIDYRDVDFTVPCALLMGAEKDGVSDAGAALADEHILIPMMGMVGSLNVSTAAGIILVEAQNQRLKAGLYEQSRLDPQEYSDTLFEWSFPDLADFCHKKGLEYPPLDELLALQDAPAWYQAVREGLAAKRQW
ncbi:tRNA (guanosine(18)-2'-O)-methyltransferase TrmH [Amphritea sp. 2_MG-2023]|jgi:tRNA (guanosine-2'-O-)-methyltransferase|uniref:tRNA (guanosine(18)-2'-O)-methyltransferase TrmH n=1 Tax=Amphritea TaxID=515417 RepID=UPI001C069E28|nr:MULTISPECIES: tRNA (guanosine(18)-2'-O)-methyltransferase TrmH [Amphritea]MBU2965344.1 tRNA (guanosine(18)-2'-O)-methyltransferase TrmH [Amphritea atlantica]MDO6419989.1 tRNA (guanosine(18)-2'-O)-methyltransferase TrmH [Amphritea sp. 2_MG-2023]MDX2421806.1 tRNA (guanosine(18)-2'-O)-methyltransferase TrmH [Amphritea sp.]